MLLDEAHSIEGTPLATVLTAEVWTDRVLGASRMVDLPNRVTWYAAANNMEVRGGVPPAASSRSAWTQTMSRRTPAPARPSVTTRSSPGPASTGASSWAPC